MNKNQKIAKEMLFKGNIHPSYYRIVILENMLKNKDCLKANELYESIHKNSPTISKATLYNNLLLFEESNLINKISFGWDDIRYCLNTGKLCIYFKCKKCQKMYKFESNILDLQNTIDGHKIDKLYITAYGTCKKCL